MSTAGEGEGGACRCGGVRFAARGAPLMTFACHCSGCRRMTASAFSLNSLYPAERFEMTEGETVLGGMKAGTRHHFCASCMSWLYTVPEGGEAFVVVRSALLEDGSRHRPFADMWRREGLDWVESGAARRFDMVPGDEEFPQLLADYAGWDGRVTE